MSGSDPEKPGCVCSEQTGTCDSLQALVKGRENGDGRSSKEAHRWDRVFKEHAGKDGETVMDGGLALQRHALIRAGGQKQIMETSRSDQTTI